MLDLPTALAIVKRQAQATIDPVVSDADITDILTRTVRYTVWAASTTYPFGARVVPLAANSAGVGHLFRCVLGGVSGVSEPIWVAQPLYATLSGAYASRPYGRSSPIATGYYLPDGTLVWQEDGPAPAEMYDVRAATYQTVMERVAVAAGRTGQRLGPLQDNPQQAVQGLMILARTYAPFGPA